MTKRKTRPELAPSLDADLPPGEPMTLADLIAEARAVEWDFAQWCYSYCVTNFGVRSERRSMGNVRVSWQERPPISVASLQSSSERGVQAATADPLGW